MKRWGLAGLASGAAMALGLAGLAVSVPATALAQARAGLPGINQNGAASWGDGADDQLGNGTTASSALFGPVSGLTAGIVRVSAGGGHGLALRTDGTVWAWGTNASGQVGNGDLTNHATPVQVQGLTGVTAVAAGGAHSLALRSDGTVWAWGYNRWGQVGNGAISVAQPTADEVTGLTSVIQIAAGEGFSMALRSDGTVWAWGDNSYGELGNGTTTRSTVPVEVSGLSGVTRIAAGAYGNSAFATSATIKGVTRVWAWGDNRDGQLGDGTFTSHSTPELVTGIGAPGIADVSAGESFVVVLGTDGSIWGWGADEKGQLGNAPGQPVTRPLETFGPRVGITQLAAGGNHTLALQANGTVLAWGYNVDGELGRGSTSDSGSPGLVTGLTNVSQVSAGLDFSLAVYQPTPIAS
jgi:alpha-tubulin suppressor-like RCC1 family protein